MTERSIRVQIYTDAVTTSSVAQVRLDRDTFCIQAFRCFQARPGMAWHGLAEWKLRGVFTVCHSVQAIDETVAPSKLQTAVWLHVAPWHRGTSTFCTFCTFRFAFAA